MNKIVKLKIEDLKDPAVKLAYQNTLRIKLDNTDIENEQDIEKAWELYRNSLLESANNVCGRKVVGGARCKRTQWWNEDVRKIVKEKKLAWKRYLVSKSTEDFELYKTKRKQASEEVKRSKQLQWEKFGEKLEDNFRENQKLFWGAVKRSRQTTQSPNKHIKNNHGEIIKERGKILETWKDYFQTLHNPNITIDNEDSSTYDESNNDDSNSEDDEITMGELIRAKKKIKLGKAAGADEIFPEMVAYQDSKADKLLLKICQIAYKDKIIPNDWNISVIIPIHKSGPTTQCENYRGISLLSVPSKVYARIIETRLREKVENKIEQYQSGFRSGRSVQDHIYALRQLSEITYRYNKKAHICFIDLQKAFDSVNREQLWKALREHNVDTNLIKVIQSFYINPKGTVRINGGV